MNTIMIPIPAPPEGWVFDAVRKVKHGERRYQCGKWDLWTADTISTFEYPVAIPIPPKWTPPPAWGEIFGDGWLTVDGDIELKVWTERPNNEWAYWYHDTSDPLAILNWDMPIPKMRPPKDIPWQEAIWKIEAPK